MPITVIITGVLSVIDWIIAHQQAGGADPPQELLDQRTALRKALAEEAQRRADAEPPPGP